MSNNRHRRLARSNRPPRLALKLVGRALSWGLPLGWLLRTLCRRSLGAAARLAGEVVARLAPTSKSMEHRFLHCGNMLEDLAVHTSGLMRDSGELVRLATGRAGAEQIMDDTIAVLQPPLDYLDVCTAGLRDHLDALRGCTSLVDELLLAEAALQNAVAPLKATQTLFRVEAACLPDEARDYFVALSFEIERLHQEVGKSFRAQFQRLSETRSGLDHLMHRLDSEANSQRQQLERHRQAMQSTLGRLRTEIVANAGRELQLKSKSDRVASASERIVVALQSQDIVSQRLEHVFEGLREVQTLGTTPTVRDLADSRGTIGRIRVLIDVQAAQLQGTSQQIAEAGATIGASSQDLIATIQAFDQECVFLNDFSEVTAAANGTIQTLLDMMGDVRSMLDACARLVGDSHLQVAAVSDVTSELTGTVEELSQQMNLIALNAQIQAVHIGEGTGLEVLAAHTAATATETARIGGLISRNLQDLRRQTADQRAFFETQAANGRLQTSHLGGHGDGHVERLHAARDRVLAMLAQVGREVQAVIDAAVRISKTVAQSRREELAIDSIRLRLAALSDIMNESLGALPAGPADAVSHTRYTMAAERDAHQAVMEGRGDVATAPEPTASPPAGGGDTGVDLF